MAQLTTRNQAMPVCPVICLPTMLGKVYSPHHYCLYALSKKVISLFMSVLIIYTKSYRLPLISEQFVETNVRKILSLLEALASL